jgi:hypothetical protein
MFDSPTQAATLVALVMLVGVFLVTIVTLLKSGVDAAIRVWSVMGALTGVAFGSMTTFFFQKQVETQAVAAVTSQAQATLVAASAKASLALEQIQQWSQARASEVEDRSASAQPWSSTGSEPLASASLAETTALLEQIQALAKPEPPEAAAAH